MVEDDPATAGQRVADIGLPTGHAGHQVVEQRNIHRHREGAARHVLTAFRQQGRGNVQHVERATPVGFAQGADHQPLCAAHILIRHINAPA